MTVKKAYDTIVVGAGASGMMAAGQASRKGKNVLLVEKMKRPGRKLAITGKGRCNITNTVPLNDFIRTIQPDGRFLQSAFSQFYSPELIRFMHSIGLPTIEERGLRIFPKSGKALDVVDALVNWCKKQKVDILVHTRLTSVLHDNKKIAGIEVEDQNGKRKKIETSHLIVATGGLSYPLTGSTGDGYSILEQLGHTIESTYPTLVPLETAGDFHQKLNGLSLRNIQGAFWHKNKKICEEFGEMSFYEHGISGPIILSMSRIVVPLLRKKESITFSLDLKPALSHEKLDKRLIREFNNNGKETLRSILNRLLPKKLIPICLRTLKLSANKPGHQIDGQERKLLRNWLKDFRLEITGYRDFDEAIVTAGGISTREVDQKTMESKIIKGLYITGEVLDLDGPTGGFNLQIAFSTGWVAGKAASSGL